jgi:laccase
MKSWSLPTAAAVVAATIFFSLSTMALPAASAIVEHTFVVSLIILYSMASTSAAP